MVKISIILPVYNDEEFLAQSIDSVIEQTITDIELICINDGSTDNSLKILNEYANKYNCIKIINQQNKGAAAARNKAILQSSGEYIGFLDSDDFYLDKDALNEMYILAKENNANMVSANIKSLNTKGKLVTNYNLEEFQQKGDMKPEDYGIPWTFGKNIYKREFLIDNNFIFPRYSRGEDPVFLAKILVKLDKIYFVPNFLMGIRDARYHGLYKIDNYEKKWGYIKHFHDTFKILQNNNFNKMKKRYEKKLFEFLNFSRNFADNEMYHMVQEIFRDDNEILEKCKDIFSFSKPKISVIIPITNKEEYLDNMVDNLLKQSFRDLEFIFVNKGFRNNIPHIIKEFIKRDYRAKFINHDFNEKFLKNIAIDFASGEYILLYDPKDSFKHNIFKKLYNIASKNNSDLVLFKIARLNNDNSIDYGKNLGFSLNECFKDVDFNKTSFNFWELKNFILNSNFNPFGKLYKKELLQKLDDYYFAHDNIFNYIILHVISMIQSNNISFVNEFLYYQSFHVDFKQLEISQNYDVFEIFNKIKTYLTDIQAFNQFKEDYLLFKFNYLTDLLESSDDQFYQFVKNNIKEIDNIDDFEDEWLIKKLNFILSSDSPEDYAEFINEIKLDNLNHEKYVLNQHYYELLNKHDELQEKYNHKLSVHNGLLSSTSWKLTKPLRNLKNRYN